MKPGVSSNVPSQPSDTLTINQYQMNAALTSAPPSENVVFRLAQVRQGLGMNLAHLRGMCHALDPFKKYVFYGKATNGLPTSSSEEGKASDAPIQGEPQLVKELRMLHSVIGIATELGELLDHLVFSDGFKNNLEIGEDLVGFGEELQDVAWYINEGWTAIGVLAEDQLKLNNEKLLARYQRQQQQALAFNADGAINRNLDKERAILEGKPEAEYRGPTISERLLEQQQQKQTPHGAPSSQAEFKREWERAEQQAHGEHHD